MDKLKEEKYKTNRIEINLSNGCSVIVELTDLMARNNETLRETITHSIKEALKLI